MCKSALTCWTDSSDTYWINYRFVPYDPSIQVGSVIPETIMLHGSDGSTCSMDVKTKVAVVCQRCEALWRAEFDLETYCEPYPEPPFYDPYWDCDECVSF